MQINEQSVLKNNQPNAENPSKIPFPEIERVSADQAFEAHKNGEAVLLDVRESEAYEALHIAGAVLIPLGELEARLNELEKSRPVITYCT